MEQAAVLQPFGEVARDVADPLSLSSRGLCATLAQPEAANASSSVSVTSAARIVVHSFQAMM
jgi:hypothetical protein